MKKTILLVIALLCCSNAFSGGSLPAKDVMEILQRNQSLWTFLSKTLDFSETAYGVRCGSHWPSMGGARIAPYTIAVTQKGMEKNQFLLTIECEQHFYDKNNKEIPLKDAQITDEIISRAVRVEEKPLFVTLCPDDKK
jgi:hypothetical protein